MTEAKGKIIEGSETRRGYLWQRTKEREREKVVKHLTLKTDAKQMGTKKHVTLNTGP